MDRDAVHRRPTRLERAIDLVERTRHHRRPLPRQALGQLARRPARDIGLGVAGVIDDLGLRQVASDQHRGRLGHRRGDREVARRDDADSACPRRRIDLRVVVRGRPGGTDHDRDAALDRRQGVRLDRLVRGVVDQDIDAVERLADGGVDRDPEGIAAERRAEVRARYRSRHRGTQREVLGLDGGRDKRATGPSRRAGDADVDHVSSLDR